MARRPSKVTALPGPVKAAVDELLKTGRYTIDQIVAHLKSLADRGQVAPEELPSRSSVGRYAQQFDRLAEKMRAAQEMGDLWVQRLGSDPDSDVGRLIQELLKIVSFQTMKDLGESDEVTEARDLYYLAKAVQSMEAAGTVSTDRILKLRREWEAEQKRQAEQTAQAVERECREAGLSGDVADRIRRQVLGVRPQPSAPTAS